MIDTDAWMYKATPQSTNLRPVYCWLMDNVKVTDYYVDNHYLGRENPKIYFHNERDMLMFKLRFASL